MPQKATHIFTGREISIAYALGAERIVGHDAQFLNANPSLVPIFVSQLFQSLEVAIKYAGIESKLFTEPEARQRSMRHGHGIKELANLAAEKLGSSGTIQPVVMAMTCCNECKNSEGLIREMICGGKFSRTRDCYASRCLGYGQVADGDFAYCSPIPDWIAAVKETATNLPKTIGYLSQWRQSPSRSKHFAIWAKNGQKHGNGE